MPEQTEWGIELPEDVPASPANGEYREPMDEARKAGLEVRNATRLERAQQRNSASGERVRTVREAYQATMRANEDGLPWTNPWAAVVAALDAYDEPATKALAETATELGRRLGRREATEEIAALLVARRSEITPNRPGWVYLTEAIGMVTKVAGG